MRSVQQNAPGRIRTSDPQHAGGIPTVENRHSLHVAEPNSADRTRARAERGARHRHSIATPHSATERAYADPWRAMVAWKVFA